MPLEPNGVAVFAPTPRKLENAFTHACSSMVIHGRWVSFDEQMVKSTARAMFYLMRFNKSKPIKHGESGLKKLPTYTAIEITGDPSTDARHQVSYLRNQNILEGVYVSGHDVKKCFPSVLYSALHNNHDTNTESITPRVLVAFACVGIKGWGVCCPSGFCYVQSIDGGFRGDKELRPFDKCPLGRTF